MAAGGVTSTSPLTGFRLAATHQGILALLLVLEAGVFSVIGRNFATLGNTFEVLRLSVEIGLLALALTPVIITGGIDLSVGSLMGLSAVLFGKMWRDGITVEFWKWTLVDTGPLPIGAAVAGTLVFGTMAGALNALLIARLR